jgi:hypothetical protein
MYRIMANPRKQLPEREHLQYSTAIMFYDQGRGERVVFCLLGEENEDGVYFFVKKKVFENF